MLNLKVTKPLLLTAGLLFTACGGSSSSDNNNTESNLVTNEEGQNKIPTVNAGDDGKVQINTTITIWGSARDIDGTISSYEWTKGEEVLGTELKLIYTPTVLGTDILTLTVIDNDGANVSDSLILEVVAEEVPIYDNSDPLPF